MIVKCASCQTRFKIGDDKVTEKGVKVRCTKCGTIFVVRREPPASEPPPPAAQAGGSRPASTPLSDLMDAAQPTGSHSPSPTSEAPDEAFGSAPDPFASLLATAARNRQPTGAAYNQSTPAPPGDPFASLGPLKPPTGAAFGGTAPTLRKPATGAAFGGPETPGPPPLPARKPGSNAAFGGSAFDAALDPLGGQLGSSFGGRPLPPSQPSIDSPASSFPALPNDDPFAGFMESSGPAPEPEPEPEPAPPPQTDLAGNFDPLAGLYLDPGNVQGGQSRQEAAPPEATPDPGQEEGPVFDSAGESRGDLFDLKARNEPLSGGPPDSPAPPQAQAPERRPIPDEAPLPTVQERKRTRKPSPAPDAPERTLAARMFNALAAGALVLLALLGFVAYRSGGRIDLRDPVSTVLAALGWHRASAGGGELPARIDGSGFYATRQGDPVLFVKGAVENRSPHAARLGLTLEVTVAGQVVATAEGVAGTLPSPEDLYQVTGPAEGKRLAERLAKAAPDKPVPPGQSADFLLFAADIPPAVRSGAEVARVRVKARALEAPAKAATAAAPLPAPDNRVPTSRAP